MKQTAVDWLENELDFLSNYLDEMAIFNLFKQAKQMERANIIDAYLTNPLEAKWKNIGTDYYNEKFNTNEK